MGRSQSTPGLVESRGRIPLEEMWVPPTASLLPYSHHSSLFSPADDSPPGGITTGVPSSSGNGGGHIVNSGTYPGRIGGSISAGAGASTPGGTGSGGILLSSRSCGAADSPISVASSVLSSAAAVQQRATASGLSEGGATPLLGSHEALEAEIKRLQEKLRIVETENAAMSLKLSNQQWDLESRIADIEMQICGASSTSSLDEERNKESVI